MTREIFHSRIGIVADESDETLGWLEFIHCAKLLDTPELTRLMQEASELRNVLQVQPATANGPSS